ncbi:MAG TPA: POTRA domain-containing protein, partial [Chthoniobacterales bacterium]|nr:POTRA domain-containing protein [Chthoniobacterales bacterium]
MLAATAIGQTAVDAPRLEEKRRAERKVEKEQRKAAQAADNIVIMGASAFDEKELRTQLKEQITAITELGLTAARADDAAFFLELFYRKQGYEKVEVRYSISGNRLRLEIDEGPRITLGTVNFVGNENFESDKLFEFFVGPTRERYGKTEKALPFVPGDLEEGVDLLRRLYVSEGYLNAIVQTPNYTPAADGTVMNAHIAIIEGRQYSFGEISFVGNTVYSPEKLRDELADLLVEPYTDRRLADIPRRLEAFYKSEGYYEVKVEATGNPQGARGGRVPVQVTISPGVVHYFDGVTVNGLTRLRPSYVQKRFSKLSGKRYDPEVLDEKFRELMKSGLFNVLQIQPESVRGDQLHLRINVEEAKQKEFGLSLGAGTYAGLIVGASYRDRNLFGYGRPLTTSAEYSSRGEKFEVLWEDPYLFDTEYELKLRLYSLTFAHNGYDKLEFGGRVDLARQWTRQYRAGVFFFSRHVEITSADIAPEFLGRTSYQVNSVGFTQTLDLRKSPLVSPRGLIIDNTFDYASEGLG